MRRYKSVSVPSTAVAEVGEEFGPWIGRSQYRTTAEFSDAVAAKYQQLYDQGYSLTMQDVAQGLVKNDPMVIGGKVDTFARTGLRDWLSNAEGIEEGPGSIIQVNRRLYDPCGSGAYRIPDVYIPGANTIFDGTIAYKTNLLDQTIDFNAFSGGGNVTIIRPSGLVTNGVQGSYGLYFP
jgi:hypothetical protein